MATCASPLSRNYRVGYGLAKGKKLEKIIEELGQVAEGVPTAEAVHSQSVELGLQLPIADEVYGMLYEGRGTGRALENLMAIPVGDELAELKGR